MAANFLKTRHASFQPTPPATNAPAVSSSRAAAKGLKLGLGGRANAASQASPTPRSAPTGRFHRAARNTDADGEGRESPVLGAGAGGHKVGRFGGGGGGGGGHKENQPSKGFEASTLGDDDDTRAFSDAADVPLPGEDEEVLDGMRGVSVEYEDDGNDIDRQVQEQEQEQLKHQQQQRMPLKTASPRGSGTFELRSGMRGLSQQPNAVFDSQEAFMQQAENMDYQSSDRDEQEDEAQRELSNEPERPFDAMRRQRDQTFAERQRNLPQQHAYQQHQEDQYEPEQQHDGFAPTELGDDTMQRVENFSPPARAPQPVPTRGRDLRGEFQQPNNAFGTGPTKQRRVRSGSVIHNPIPQVPITQPVQYVPQPPFYAQQHQQPPTVQQQYAPAQRPAPAPRQVPIQRKRPASPSRIPAPESDYVSDDESQQAPNEQGKMTIRTTEPDYDATTLASMPYSDLAAQPFDVHPSAPSHQGKKKGTLPERLAKTAQQPADAQKQFMQGLTLGEWEEAGDWFAGEFGRLMGLYVELRKGRREVVGDFEKRLEERDAMVKGKMDGVESELLGMKKGGMSLLRRRTP